MVFSPRRYNMETKEKLSAREWIENMWYHYKWLIIFGFMMIVFVIISLFQFLATKDPDVNILHIGPMYISPAAAEMTETTLTAMSEDYNGDGEIKIEILDITVNKFGNESAGIDPQNYDHNNTALQRFQTEIRAGDTVIYALDKQYFDICVNEGLLEPLDEIIDDAFMPEKTVDGYGVYISDLDAYELDGLSSFPETAILCLRRSPDKDEIKYGRTNDIWNGNKKTFINIIKYRSAED